VNNILPLSIPNKLQQSNKKWTNPGQTPDKPRTLTGGFSSARRCDLPRAQASARTRSSLETEINFFPLHKKRGEKKLLIHFHSLPDTSKALRKAPVCKTQSKGRAISNGASFAELVTK